MYKITYSPHGFTHIESEGKNIGEALTNLIKQNIMNPNGSRFSFTEHDKFKVYKETERLVIEWEEI